MDAYFETVSYWTRRRRAHATVDQYLAGDATPGSESDLVELVNNPGSESDLDELVNDPVLVHVDSQDESSTDNDNQQDNNDVHVNEDDDDFEIEFGDADFAEFENFDFANIDLEIDDFAPVENSESEGEEEPDEDIPPPSLVDRLSQWASYFRVNHAAISGLLTVLRFYHPDLPKDPRTLLGTQGSIDVLDVAGGQYYHIGVKNSVISQLQSHPNAFEDLQEILLLINIDGLPIFKSSSGQLWPILGMIEHKSFREPFVIALFYGVKKPTNAAEYLSFFVREIQDLYETGISFSGVNFGVGLHAFVCDAPARSFVKNTKCHSGYCACERCTTHGVWLNKVTFPELDADLRSDETFTAMTDEDHHTGPSPFGDLALGMVSHFPLDYMHLVCLGVMRRLILLWKKGPLATRVGATKITVVSNRLVSLRGHVPKEFARRPRSLVETDRWKATEFRQFLLYTGVLVLENNLPDAVYKNFLLLSVAVRILLSPSLTRSSLDLCSELLLGFVRHFGQLYGADNLVYNVHSLIHLPDDARRYGSLDNVSAFAFENYLGKLKKLMRKPSQPLQQIVKRLSEFEIGKLNCQQPKKRFEKEHFQGPLPNEIRTGRQFRGGNFSVGYLSLTEHGNNCVQISGIVALVKNIVVVDDNEYIVYQVFRKSEDFFTYPVPSRDVGISVVWQPRPTTKYALISQIDCKIVLLPLPATPPRLVKYLALPLMHTLM
jgi:hypothetical protein